MKVTLVFKKVKGEINFIGVYSSLEKAEEYLNWNPVLIGDEYIEKGIAFPKKGYYVIQDVEVDKKHDKMVIK